MHCTYNYRSSIHIYKIHLVTVQIHEHNEIKLSAYWHTWLTYAGGSTANWQPVKTSKVDIFRDVVATVDAGSEALWEDDDKLTLLLDCSTHMHASDLPQLIRRHLVSDNRTYC